MDSFLRMGGYWPFVWPAWGLACLVLIGLYAVSRAETRRAQRILDELRGAAVRSESRKDVR